MMFSFKAVNPHRISRQTLSVVKSCPQASPDAEVYASPQLGMVFWTLIWPIIKTRGHKVGKDVLSVACFFSTIN